MRRSSRRNYKWLYRLDIQITKAELLALSLSRESRDISLLQLSLAYHYLSLPHVYPRPHASPP
jgi:hypothetical protein